MVHFSRYFAITQNLSLFKIYAIILLNFLAAFAPWKFTAYEPHRIRIETWKYARPPLCQLSCLGHTRKHYLLPNLPPFLFWNIWNFSDISIFPLNGFLLPCTKSNLDIVSINLLTIFLLLSKKLLLCIPLLLTIQLTTYLPI